VQDVTQGFLVCVIVSVHIAVGALHLLLNVYKKFFFPFTFFHFPTFFVYKAA